MPRETTTDPRQEILRTSARLFQQQGYDGTSMNDVASALKLSKGGLYHHFQSKDEILFERNIEKDTGRVTKTPFLIKKRAVLTGDVLTDARVAIGEFQNAYVSINFDSTGAKLFERITTENVKKRMAIILDNTVYSAPVIQERISGGRAQITGSFTTEEANDLAIVLRAWLEPRERDG